MDLKNKINFFLLSFLFSFCLLFISQNVFPNIISSDTKAYAVAIFIVFLIPLLLNFIWPKVNNIILTFFYLIGVFLTAWSIRTMNIEPIKYFFAINILAVITVIVISLFITFFIKITMSFPSPFSKKLERISKKIYTLPLSNILVFFLIIFLTYDPKFKYSFEKLSLFGYESYYQFHHVTFFIIPVFELLKGKTLLINVSSLYGVVMTYLETLIFKIIGLSYSKFVLFDMVVTIAYIWIFFLIIKKVTKSFWLALLGTIIYIRLAVFRDLPSSMEIYVLPSTTPIRNFFDIIIFYLIWDYFQHKNTLKKLILMSSLVIFAFFYGFDFGLMMAVSFIMTLGYDIFLSIFYKEKTVKIISKINRYSLSILAPAVVFGILIIGYTFFRSGIFPDLGQYFFSLSANAGHLNGRSLPQVIGWHYLPLGIYLIGFYYVFYQVLVKKQRSFQSWVYLIIYGMISFTYYINLSEPNHLFSIMAPAVIIFILLLSAVINDLSALKKSPLLLSVILVAVFFVGVAWAIFNSSPSFMELAAAKIAYRYSPITDKYYYWSDPGTDFYLQDDNGRNFELAVEKIKIYSKNNQQVVIISRYAPLLHIMSGKTSLIDHPNVENDIYTVEEFNTALMKIKTLKPQFVFVHSADYSQWYSDTMNVLWNKIKENYTLKEHAGVIDVYQLK